MRLVSSIANRLLLAALLAGAVTVAGCDSGPKPGEEAVYWGEKLNKEPELAKRDAALKHIAELKDKKALPFLYGALKQPISELRPMIVEQIGLVGDETSADALVGVVDLLAGAGRDKESRIGAMTNEKAVKALSRIAQTSPAIGNNPKVVEVLRKLAGSNSMDVQLAAVVALGDLKAKDAVDDLIAIADGHPNNFMVKNAAEALTKIGDPKAADVLGKLMFFERQGVSFYREASYGLFVLGKDAIATLKTISEGKFAPIDSMHIEPNVQKTKAIVVYGDLADPSTYDMIAAATDEKGNDTATALLRIEATRAAGRIGITKAVPALKSRMDNVDISQSEHPLAALTQMGERSVANALYEMSTSAGFMKQCKAQDGTEEQCRFSERQIRKPRLLAWTRLAPGADADKLDKMIADEGNAEIKADLEKLKPRMQVAKDCIGKGTSCFIEALKSPDAMARDRAAYELLWATTAGDDAARDALIGALSDGDNEVRYAAIMGVLRRMPKDSAALADKVKAQIESEKGKTQFVRINEDLKRLEVRLRRGY